LIVVVLRNRDDRLVAYTSAESGYLLPSPHWVPFLRALQFVNAAAFGVAFAVIRPDSGWEFVGAVVAGVIVGHATEFAVLAFLTRTEDTLSVEQFRDHALAQQSTAFLLGLAWITGALAALMFAVALTVRGAPPKVVALAVVLGLVCLLYVQRLRKKRRAPSP
jgi:hypothetical protein